MTIHKTFGCYALPFGAALTLVERGVQAAVLQVIEQQRTAALVETGGDVRRRKISMQCKRPCESAVS